MGRRRPRRSSSLDLLPPGATNWTCGARRGTGVGRSYLNGAQVVAEPAVRERERGEGGGGWEHPAQGISSCCLALWRMEV